jgi:hypothetical protein
MVPVMVILAMMIQSQVFHLAHPTGIAQGHQSNPAL